MNLSKSLKRGIEFIAVSFFLFSCSFAQVAEPVPVLCYHGFTDDTSAMRGKLTELYARFEEMLKFLKANGYQSSFPEDLASDGRKGAKPVVLTFDDGRREQLRAAEIMRDYGMRGIFFIIPSRMSGGDPEFMTREDLARLIEWGHQIGVHGYRHRSMVESPEETDSVRTTALAVISQSVPSQREFPNFAFPFGHYDTSVVSVTSGIYPFLHTVNPGYWDRRSKLLPRMLITSDRPAQFLQEYIRTASSFKPLLVPLTQDGAWTSVVSFHISGAVPSGLAIIAVSADKDGYHYTSHPATEVTSVEGDVLSFDLQKYLGHFFRETRMVLSYAFVKQDRGSLYYISSGQSNWVKK